MDILKINSQDKVNRFFFALISALLILILICGALPACYAQSSGNVPANTKIASPTAASLGKMVDFPVSYHTGIPSIQIPLHTVVEGPLQLPISLNYHAGGLKVSEQASWVGAGWNLDCGGIVTRTIRGHADDKSGSGYAFSYIKDQGYYNYLYDGTNQLQTYAFANGQLDGEPDLFFFNFNGHTGSFYFRADNSIVIQPQQDIKIVPTFCGGSSNTPCVMTQKEIVGWTFFMSDGTRYVFGRTDEVSAATPGAYEITQTLQMDGPNEGYSYSPLSSWYLSLIKSDDVQHSITLEYASEKYSYYTLALYPTVTSSGGMSIVKNLVEGVRLSKITSTEGTVTFVPYATPRVDLSQYATSLVDYENLEAKALREIKIAGTGFSKSFDLRYTYFTDSHGLQGNYNMTPGVVSMNNLHTDAKRLKLDYIKERSADSTVMNPPYRFSYYEDTSVPRTLSLAQDHWGFFNNAVSNQSLVPSISLDGGYIYSNGDLSVRDPAWPAMRAGTLKSIQYPTGGVTEFTFKNHSVLAQRSSIEYVPGKSYGPIAIQSGLTSPKTDLSVVATAPFNVHTEWTYMGPDPVNYPCHGGYMKVDFIKSDGTVDLTKSYSQNISFGTKETTIRLLAGNYKFYMVSSDDRSYCSVSGTLNEQYFYTRYEDMMVGGLRVEGITSSTSESSSLTKTFSYDSSGQSQGILFSRPNYVAVIRNESNAESGVPSDTNWSSQASLVENGCFIYNVNGGNHQYYYAISPGSIHPMQTSQGNHIGYNRVTETQADGGYTMYNFARYDNPAGDVSLKVSDWTVCNTTVPNYPPAPLPFDPHRGELVRTRVFNAGGVLLKETRQRNDYAIDLVGVTGLAVKLVNNAVVTTEYEIKPQRMTKSSQLEWQYDPGAPTMLPVGKLSETFYAASAYNLPAKQVVTAVNAPALASTAISQVLRGKILDETRTSFVSDINLCATPFTVDQTLSADLAALMGNYISAKSAASTFHDKFAAWVTYKQNVNNRRKTYVTERTNYFTALEACWTGTTTWNNASNDLRPIIDLRNRGQIGTVLETSQWRDGNFLGSFFNTYQSFAGIRRYIYPSKLETIRPSTLSPTFTPMSNTATGLVKDLRYSNVDALEETYIYAAGGYINEIRPRSGVVISFLWDTSTKRLIAKAVGAANVTLQGAFSTLGLANIRNDANLSKALVNTYTYSPFIGLTSQTDPTGLMTSYTYDLIGRLSLVKDNNGSIQKKINYHYKGQAHP